MRTIRIIPVIEAPTTVQRAVGNCVQWLDYVAYVRLAGEDRVYVVEGDRPSSIREMLAMVREGKRETT